MVGVVNVMGRIIVVFWMNLSIKFHLNRRNKTLSFRFFFLTLRNYVKVKQQQKIWHFYRNNLLFRKIMVVGMKKRLTIN
jgi:hypothetical protein